MYILFVMSGEKPGDSNNHEKCRWIERRRGMEGETVGGVDDR